ncbi:MAG TPA: hypothetical protein V6C84_24830 [Coleofasciculaceae cyanobacterium]|jgi:hypothetical protein
MTTDKPGVMTFLNPEIYSRLVAFKEKQCLRSLSHATELVLGEYFGVDITPITLHQSAPLLENPPRSPETLAAKVDRLRTDYESFFQGMVDIQHIIGHLISLQNSASLASKPVYEHTSALSVSPSWLASPYSSGSSIEPLPDNSPHFQVSSNDVSDHTVSAILARKGLTGLQLADRLKIHSSIISRKKQKSYFKEWTCQLDPIGLSWKYSSVTHRFHPTAH